MKLESIEGIKFLPDHQIVSEVTAADDEEEEEEEEEETASPALVPLETEEAPAAPAAPAPAELPEENNEECEAAMRAALQNRDYAEYIRLKNSRK